MKKLLISTPVFDSRVCAAYLTSLVGSIQYLISEQWEFTLFTEARGFVSQARNRAAEFAIKGKYDKLLFIDADIAWEPTQIIRLLRSDKLVVGGAYPFRTFPIKLNLIPPQGTGMVDFKEYCEKNCDQQGNVEMYRVPTGFLMCDVKIFEKIAPLAKTYHTRDPILNIREDERNFFPADITEAGILHSEDWGFCDLVQRAGEKVYFNAYCVVDHIGSHRFSAVTPTDESYNRVTYPEAKALAPNPFSKWPVNLSCFCGSGMKFKKCCEPKMPSQVPVKDAEILKADFEKQLQHVQGIHDRGNIFKKQGTIFKDLKQEPGTLE
jgi:hypothetical protein